jgi:3-oxoadipate enol-lactonase
MRGPVALAALAVACGGGGRRVEVIPVVDEVVEAGPRLAGEDVTWQGADGVALAGTYAAPSTPTAACVLFAHQLSSTRAEWAPIFDGLRGRAHLLAVDLRGHGASGPAPGAWRGFGTSDWEAVEGDLAAALEVLAARGAGPRCAVIGASIGSSAALRLAGARPDRIGGVVLLSPGLAYRGLATPDAARATRAPVLIIHSQERGAVDAATALAEILRANPGEVEVVADPGAAHGMKIVAGDPALIERVVAFLAANAGS